MGYVFLLKTTLAFLFISYWFGPYSVVRGAYFWLCALDHSWKDQQIGQGRVELGLHLVFLYRAEYDTGVF